MSGEGAGCLAVGRGRGVRDMWPPREGTGGPGRVGGWEPEGGGTASVGVNPPRQDEIRFSSASRRGVLGLRLLLSGPVARLSTRLRNPRYQSSSSSSVWTAAAVALSRSITFKESVALKYGA